MDFSEESGGDRLLLKIGDTYYPLEDRSINEDGSALEVEIGISPEMAEKGKHLFLVSVPDESGGTFRTGPLNYGDCPVNDGFLFYEDGSKGYFRFEKKTVRKYLLTLEEK